MGEWVAVMAFYAAVHSVNAYLWETRRYIPRTHRDRRHAIENDPQISGCGASYGTLQDDGYQARYNEGYSLTEQGARDLLEINFRQVEATVMRAQGQPIPVW